MASSTLLLHDTDISFVGVTIFEYFSAVLMVMKAARRALLEAVGDTDILRRYFRSSMVRMI